MRRLSLWSADLSPTSVDVEEAVLLTRAGGLRVPGEAQEADCIAIVSVAGPLPAGAGEGAQGVALVPASLARAVARNGTPLDAGLHLLHHRDALAVGGRRFWVASRAVVEETSYQPERHGADIFCGRTRRRLQAGEPVVVCPGTEERGCELIYAAVAWRTRVRCHQCGFEPGQAPWRPPPAAAEGRVHQLLARFGGRRRR